VHDEERNGRPSLLTENLKEGANAKFRDGSPFTVSELYEYFADGYRSKIQKVVKN
jgi:hypothetical protein